MVFTKKVQFLGVEHDNMFKYSFLDIESNLPFDIFSLQNVEVWNDLERYSLYDLDFNLVRVNDSKKGLCWKIKAVA